MKNKLNVMMNEKLVLKGLKKGKNPSVELYILALSELKDELFNEWYTDVNKKENFNYEEALEYIQGQVDHMKKGGLI